MSSQPPKVLDSLRTRVRRLQFIVGLGFFSLVLGMMLSGALITRLGPRLQDLPVFLQEPMAVVLRNLWLLVVLPVVCYGASLILELKPLSTALGATATGVLFLGAIFAVSEGTDGLWSGLPQALLHVSATAAGVLLSYRAVKRGRAAAEQRSAQAQAQAQARKTEYVEFLREAERGGEKSAQRESERAAVTASAGGAAVAVAEAPAPAVVEAPAPAVTEPAPAPAASAEPAPAAPSPDAAAEPREK